MTGKHTESSGIPSAGEASPAWIRLKRTLGLARSERGSGVVEMALVLPMLLTIVMGIIAFGIAFNNYLVLTNATGSGALGLASIRGQGQDICTLTSQTVTGAATNLTPAKMRFTVNIYAPPTGTAAPCTGSAALTGTGSGVFACGIIGTNAAISENGCAQITVTYPLSLMVYGHNFAPAGSVLTAQTTEAIQ